MMTKIRSHAGRLTLLGVGIPLTSTVGHTAARLMATQMALQSPGFAFELAMLIAALLVAASLAAFQIRRSAVSTDGTRVAGSPVANDVVARPQAMAMTTMSAPQIAQLRLPPGTRLDSNEAIMITSDDAARRIIHVNPAFVRMTGFSASEWIGRSGDLLLADGPLRMESLLWLDTEPNGREAHWIARLHRRDGVQFCAEAHLHPMAPRDKAGRPYVVLVMNDVTSRVGAGKSRDQNAATRTGTHDAIAGSTG